MVNDKMKKIYSQPACMVVELGTAHMMAESMTINIGSSTSISKADQILVKEENTSDVNVWDEEW